MGSANCCRGRGPFGGSPVAHVLLAITVAAEIAAEEKAVQAEAESIEIVVTPMTSLATSSAMRSAAESLGPFLDLDYLIHSLGFVEIKLLL